MTTQEAIGFFESHALDPNSQEARQARLERATYITSRCHPSCRCKSNLERKLARNAAERQKLEKELLEADADHTEAESVLACVRCERYVNDLYFVHDTVWASAGFPPNGVAHYRCLERALGRAIQLEDLPPIRGNEMLRHLLGSRQ